MGRGGKCVMGVFAGAGIYLHVAAKEHTGGHATDAVFLQGFPTSLLLGFLCCQARQRPVGGQGAECDEFDRLLRNRLNRRV